MCFVHQCEIVIVALQRERCLVVNIVHLEKCTFSILGLTSFLSFVFVWVFFCLVWLLGVFFLN